MFSAFGIPRYAVITTHNRPEELGRLVNQLLPQLDYVVIVDNASEPAVDPLRYGPYVLVIRDMEQPPNLYRLWNVGLIAVSMHAHDAHYAEWNVAVFNDDADVPPGWYDVVAEALRSGPYLAASTASHQAVHEKRVMTQRGGSLTQRMCPWAFVTRGEAELRGDEDFRWWYGDTDFEWRCREGGGVIMVPGPTVNNTLANSTTVGELAVQAGRDGETFKRKWGHLPW